MSILPIGEGWDRVVIVILLINPPDVCVQTLASILCGGRSSSSSFCLLSHLAHLDKRKSTTYLLTERTLILALTLLMNVEQKNVPELCETPILRCVHRIKESKVRWLCLFQRVCMSVTLCVGVFMCLCVVTVFVYVYVSLSLNISFFVFVFLYLCVSVFVSLSLLCVRVFVCLYLCVSVSLCMSMCHCSYVSVYVSVFVCLYE